MSPALVKNWYDVTSTRQPGVPQQAGLPAGSGGASHHRGPLALLGVAPGGRLACCRVPREVLPAG